MDKYVIERGVHHNTLRDATLGQWKRSLVEFLGVLYPKNLNILSSTDFYNDSLSISLPEEAEVVKEMERENKSHLGRMFSPWKERKEYYIIIRDELFKADWRAMSTFAHEFVHAIDFDDLICVVDNEYKTNIKEHPLYIPLFCWSEFHSNYIQRLFTMWVMCEINNQKYTSCRITRKPSKTVINRNKA